MGALMFYLGWQLIEAAHLDVRRRKDCRRSDFTVLRNDGVDRFIA
jgi:hypothetical protein